MEDTTRIEELILSQAPVTLTRRDLLSWTAGALAGVGTQFSSRAAQAYEHVPLAVVVPKQGPIERLSRLELKRLYLGSNLHAPGGERILAYHQMPDAADRIAFEQQVTGMQPQQLAQYWLDRRTRGESRTHGIGYVRWDQVGPELRAIPIDGSLPGDPGYPIWADDSEPTAAGLSLYR
jgi:hypothetical protein